MNKSFALNLLSQGSIENDYLSKNKKVCVFWVFDENRNFSTKFQYKVSLKKTAIYNLLSLITIYSPKNDNKQPSEMRN